MSTKTKKVPKKGQKCKMCKNAKSAIYQNWPMLIPHPSRTQQIAQKPQQKTIVCKEKSGWMKIHQKPQKCNLFKKSWFKYFWTKTFPKRYDTCRGLFFTLASPQGQGDMVRWPYGQIWPNMAKWCLCIKLSGVKLSAVSNCLRCEIVLVSNCPRIFWISAMPITDWWRCKFQTGRGKAAILLEGSVGPALPVDTTVMIGLIFSDDRWENKFDPNIELKYFYYHTS